MPAVLSCDPGRPQALLEQDFNLRWELPSDRLCPTIPQKLNYIHWVEDLLALGPRRGGSEPIRGIDVGTGASCIYPLLAAAMHPNWSFVATELDARSLASAMSNVAQNALQGRIDVRAAGTQTDAVLRGSWLKWPADGEAAEQQYDFCMCNPPFFTSVRRQTTPLLARTRLSTALVRSRWRRQRRIHRRLAAARRWRWSLRAERSHSSDE